MSLPSKIPRARACPARSAAPGRGVGDLSVQQARPSGSLESRQIVPRRRPPACDGDRFAPVPSHPQHDFPNRQHSGQRRRAQLSQLRVAAGRRSAALTSPRQWGAPTPASAGMTIGRRQITQRFLSRPAGRRDLPSIPRRFRRIDRPFQREPHCLGGPGQPKSGAPNADGATPVFSAAKAPVP
jgi:hypothetical protein